LYGQFIYNSATFGKHREYNIETQLLFVDYYKALDSVLLNKLWEIMNEKGIPAYLIRIVQSMYQNAAIVIRKDRTNDNSFVEINKAVRQDCPLSPVLFNIYIDKVITEWQHMIKQNVVMNLILNTILFADDQVIVTSTEDDMQRALYALNNVAI
jgi:hypothetical protein